MTHKLCSTHFQTEERALDEGTECQIVPWRECEVCQKWLSDAEAAWQKYADALAAEGYTCRDPNAHRPLWDGPEGEVVYLARSMGSLNWHVETYEGDK